MITRENIKELFNQLSNTEKLHIKKSLGNFEYVLFTASFFNVGVRVNYELSNDLPADYEERASEGNFVALELSEAYDMLTLKMDKKVIEGELKYYADYFEAMFWADIEANEDFTEEQQSASIYDIEEQSLIKSLVELEQFFDRADNALDGSDYTHKQACHDFYMTRVGHGVGFWENDHCNEEQGKELTAIAQEFGTVDIGFNDAGQVVL